MGLSKKVAGAVTFWTHPDARRRDILGATITWGWSMSVIGLVFLILVCTGTFPARVIAPPGSPAFALYVIKYIFYILSGGCACVGVMAARGALTSRRPTTAAKALLGAGAVLVVASAAMTVVVLVRSALAGHAAHVVPAYVYIIEVVIILIRLLFASILALAIWTLVEADRDPAVADMALTGCGPISQLPVSSKAGFDQPAPYFYAAPPPAAAAAAAGPWHTQQQQHGMMAPAAAAPTAVLYPMKQAATPVYPPQPQQQQSVVWGAPAVPVAAAAGPTDSLSSYLAFKQQRRQNRGLARFL